MIIPMARTKRGNMLDIDDNMTRAGATLDDAVRKLPEGPVLTNYD
jgi:hypothetical protein